MAEEGKIGESGACKKDKIGDTIFCKQDKGGENIDCKLSNCCQLAVEETLSDPFSCDSLD